MRDVSKKTQDMLGELKGYVEEWYDYWQKNNKSFNDNKNFTFLSNLTQQDLSVLNALQKPPLEFNSIEAFVSRQRGEFSDHEPSIICDVADGVLPSRITPDVVKTTEVVEGHISYVMYEAKQQGLQDHIWNDTLAGGFGVAKVRTDYINEMSFEQKIVFDRVFDPTLCGFDPLARLPHKGDGRYCFEIIPKTKEEFEQEFGEARTKNMKFSKNVGSFSWSYGNSKLKIVLIAEVWVKKRKREKIAKLANGHTILSKHYPKLKELWDLQQRIEQIPAIIEERYEILESIDLYEICETGVLRHTPSDYFYLPLVFFNGNSVIVKHGQDGVAEEATRSLIYQAKGIQKLKNIAGQTIASEIETMVENKWVVAAESLSEDYIDAFKNPQKMQSVVYQAFLDGNPEHPIPPPREVVRTPMPDIVWQTFTGADRLMQATLGSYDAELGIAGGGDTSGKAIQQGALHSGAATKPFLTNYMHSLNRVAQIFLDLIPKYYVTPRSIPVIKPNGTRGYQIINDEKNPDSLTINYRPRELQIKVEAGLNSKLEKQITLQQITSLMAASEAFAAFANEMCLPELIQNMSINGADAMRLKAEEWMAKRKEQQEAAAGQPSPEDKLLMTQAKIEGDKTAQRREESQGKLAIEAAKVSIEQQNADREFLKLLAEVEAVDRKTMRDSYALDHEISLDSLEAALSVSQHHFDMEQAQKQQMASQQGGEGMQ